MPAFRLPVRQLVEFLLRTGISGIGIRMILLRQLPVCFFDCIFISVLFDA